MNGIWLSGLATILVALPSTLFAQVAGDVGTFECRAVQNDAQLAVDAGAPFRNKGALMKTVTGVVNAGQVTESCADCIIPQFAKGVGATDQAKCGPDAVCGDGICTVGEAWYSCARDCSAELGQVAGVSTRFIPRADACGNAAGRTCESLEGNVVSDALRLTYGVDFAIQNAGGLRADLTCPTTDVPSDFCPPYTPPPYPITNGAVFAVLPFGNVAVTLTVNGAELKTMLENAVSSMPTVQGRFAQVSGLCFTYEITAVAGSRVTSAVRQAANGSCTGAAIDLSSGATYDIAINDFMAMGGDGYPNFSGRYTTRDNEAKVVADYIGAHSPISPAIQGRVSCTSSGGTACPVELRTVTLTFNASVPASTDGTGRSVFIAGFLDRLDGNLPQWDPSGVALTRVDATHWSITLTGKEGTQLEYKYTNDGWNFVEKDGTCAEIANRQLTLSYGATGTQLVNDSVANWRNVVPCGP